MIKKLGPVHDYHCFQVVGKGRFVGLFINEADAVAKAQSLGEGFSVMECSITSNDLLIHDNSKGQITDSLQEN